MHGLDEQELSLWKAGLSLPGVGFCPSVLISMPTTLSPPSSLTLAPSNPTSTPTSTTTQSPSITTTLSIPTTQSIPTNIEEISHLANLSAGLPSLYIPPPTSTSRKPIPKRPLATSTSTSNSFSTSFSTSTTTTTTTTTTISPAVSTSVSTTPSLQDLADPNTGRVPDYTYPDLARAAIVSCHGAADIESLLAAIAKRFPLRRLLFLLVPGCSWQGRRWAETDHWKTASTGVRNALYKHDCFRSVDVLDGRGGKAKLWTFCEDGLVGRRQKDPKKGGRGEVGPSGEESVEAGQGAGAVEEGALQNKEDGVIVKNEVV